MTQFNIKEDVEEIEATLIATRRELHQNPELSNEEFNTSKRIQEFLTKEDIPFTTGYATNGILAVIEGSRPGKTIAIRADMDALPIQEKNNHEFVSKTENKMHACGHDAHVSMLIGTGMLLNRYKAELSGTVLLVFQPAEENAPIGGANKMMEDGVFDTYKPDAIFAQHVWPDLPVGQIGVRLGAMMANSDRFKITINGSSGHASMPHQTVDAITVAIQVVSSLQTIVSRNTDPLKSAVLTVGKIQGGTRFNVIANQVTLEGTVRTYNEDVRAMIKQKLIDISNGVSSSMGAEAQVEYLFGYNATTNSENWASLVKETAQEALGKEATPTVSPSMGGEDFSRFLLKYPGAYFWLGTAIPSRKVQRPLHDPEFDIDEQALIVGVEVMTKVAIKALTKLDN